MSTPRAIRTARRMAFCQARYEEPPEYAGDDEDDDESCDFDGLAERQADDEFFTNADTSWTAYPITTTN